MKTKSMILIFSIFLMLICIGCVSASENASALALDDSITALESANVEKLGENVITVDGTAPLTTSNVQKASKTSAVKKESLAVLCEDGFVKKTNRYFKVKAYAYNEDTNKLDTYKGVKLTVKVTFGKTVKTYHVTTDKKGEAKVFNVKKLKAGSYKVSVTSDDARYSVKEKGSIYIFNKKQNTVTVKGVEKEKVIGKNAFRMLYFKKDGQYDKGTYIESYPAKDFFGSPHSFVVKAKIFLKNKKTGKTMTKTIKHKRESFYGWDAMKLNLIKGYTPYKAKLWYVTR